LKIFKTTKTTKEYLKNNKNETIGFVPTMGALHDGHLSLIKQSKEQNDITIVSIFVNPTQFLDGEDIDKYPHKPQADEKICEIAKVDVLFVPNEKKIYFDQETKLFAPSIKAYILEGYDRPGHFDGVLQVVNKLLNIVKPTFVYFGKKDAQQLYLVKNMVEEFFLDVSVVACETIREANGLAKSSRNTYLSKEDTLKALQISKALNIAIKYVQKGEYDAATIKTKISKQLKNLYIYYVEIVDKNFNYIDKIEINNTIVLVAVNINNTRLIDNIWL